MAERQQQSCPCELIRIAPIQGLAQLFKPTLQALPNRGCGELESLGDLRGGKLMVVAQQNDLALSGPQSLHLFEEEALHFELASEICSCGARFVFCASSFVPSSSAFCMAMLEHELVQDPTEKGAWVPYGLVAFGAHRLTGIEGQIARKSPILDHAFCQSPQPREVLQAFGQCFAGNAAHGLWDLCPGSGLL